MSASLPAPLPDWPLAVGQSVLLGGLETQQQLGGQFARLVAAHAPDEGQVLFLEGELGAGKTSFTQGLVQWLGFTEPVTSPTYALMHIYPTPLGRVLHVDAYRVRDAGELYEMDLEDLIAGSRVSVIEWGSKLYADYPEAPILHFEHVEGRPEERRITRIR